MSFSVLVMKTPTACVECDLEDQYVMSHNCPLIYRGETDEFRKENVHPECPLRELPGLRTVNCELDQKRKTFFEQYVNGWNDCIAEILGNMEGEECMADAENAEGSSPIPSVESGDSGQTAGQK